MGIERIVHCPTDDTLMPTENLHYSPLYVRNDAPQPDGGSGEQQVWVVMRSRKEKITVKGTKLYGYEAAQTLVPQFFMPMKERVSVRAGRQIRSVAPAIPDIFFVKDTLSHLSSIVNADNGIEYLYVKGQPYRQPVVVRDSEMENFIAATTSSQRVTFHTAASDTLSHLIGRRVRITVGATVIEGELLTVRGSRRRRLRVSLPASLTTLTAYIDLTLPPNALIEHLG